VGPGDFLYELELLRFVRERGVSVAAPVARRDGGLLGAVQTEAGTRYCALFEFAEGAIRGDLTPEQGWTVGRTLAEFHRAADEFQPSRPEYSRYDMDLRYLLEQPVELVDQFQTEHGRPGTGRFKDGFSEVRERVRALPRDGGRYGVTHGDPHRGNVAVTEDGGVTLFDFDHGGFGWRGYDLAVCMGSGGPEDREPRIAGYESVRPISGQERDLLPVFRKLNALWDLGDVLAMRAAWGTDEEIGAKFAERAEERLGRLFGDVTAAARPDLTG
jgi:Ser/Thr protein kinase RdoA (MazF antagonist)